MALGIYFSPAAMSTEQYDDVIRRLDTIGAGKPAGRRSHFCFGPSGTLQVFDVWDSLETFEAFGQILMPILAEMGVEPGEPSIQPIHNQIAG